MADRYRKLFSLPAELYTPGAPLLIAAGALQRDEQTGWILAQLKLRNIGALPVKAVKVSITPMDTVGRQLGDAVLYDYLDLFAPRGADFGSRNPIYLPDPVTRSFKAEIKEVAFADNSLWVAPEGAVWSPLPEAQPIENALGDPELVNQLRLEKGADCRFLPIEAEDLWRCTCGELVRKGDPCPKCRRSFFTLDIRALAQAKDVRLFREREEQGRAAAEAKKAAEAKAARAKKARTAGIFAGAVLLVAALVLAFLLLGLPAITVSQADQDAAAGDYVAALEKYRSASEKSLYETLFHPREKATAIVPAAHYQEGEEALAGERYLDAIASFEAAGAYRDAGARIPACWYQEGEKAFAEERYADAYAAFTSSGTRPEEASVWDKCCLGQLQADLAAGNLKTADGLLKEVQKGPEKNRMYLCLAQAYLKAGRYQDAASNLVYIMQADPELEEEAKATRYQVGVGLYDAEDFVRAEYSFSRLGDYQDAKRYVQLSIIGQTRRLAAQGKTELLLSYVKKVDPSCLLREEKELFLADVYAWGKKNEALRTEQGYMDAFVLYKMSGHGDYLARMDACNEKYLDMPHPVRSFAWTDSDMGSAGKLEKAMEWIYRDGQLSLTIHFTAKKDLRWSLFRTNGGGGYVYKHGTVTKGSTSLTVTIPYSALSGYNEIQLDLSDNNYSNYGYLAVYTSTFQSKDQDLYDRFGGKRL